MTCFRADHRYQRSCLVPQSAKEETPSCNDPGKGPYVVIKRINDLVYRIQLGPNRKPKVVHRNRLWHYTGSNPPTWFGAMLESTPVTPTTYPAVAREQETGTNRQPPPAMGSSNLETTTDLQPRRSSRQRRQPQQYGSDV